jgi:hypothetical protein
MKTAAVFAVFGALFIAFGSKTVGVAMTAQMAIGVVRLLGFFSAV